MAWTAGSYVRSGRLLARALTDRQGRGASCSTRSPTTSPWRPAPSPRWLAPIADGVPVSRALLDGGAALAAVIPDPVEVVVPEHEPTLRERGEGLLERSRDVWSDEEPHPAYVRILDDLAPDEARILVHMLRAGPQPAVDVRTGGPDGHGQLQPRRLGADHDRRRAPGCGTATRCRRTSTTCSGSGLVWFSSEQVEDPMDYQVLEAQPDVLEAMHSVRFPKLVRRSIHLTPFGINFCRTCLVDPTTVADLPEHGAPRGLTRLVSRTVAGFVTAIRNPPGGARVGRP